jgi:hypothetical protein
MTLRSGDCQIAEPQDCPQFARYSTRMLIPATSRPPLRTWPRSLMQMPLRTVENLGLLLFKGD